MLVASNHSNTQMEAIYFLLLRWNRRLSHRHRDILRSLERKKLVQKLIVVHFFRCRKFFFKIRCTYSPSNDLTWMRQPVINGLQSWAYVFNKQLCKLSYILGSITSITVSWDFAQRRNHFFIRNLKIFIANRNSCLQNILWRNHMEVKIQAVISQTTVDFSKVA